MGRNSRLFLVALIFFGVTSPLRAEGECVGYQVTEVSPLGPFTTKEEACSAWASKVAASNEFYVLAGHTTDEGASTCHADVYDSRYGPGSGFNGTIGTVAMECPNNGTCNSAAAGQTFSSHGSGTAIPSDVCDTNTGCKAVLSGVGVLVGAEWAGSFKVTTSVCEEGSTQLPVSNRQEGEDCVTGTSGMEYCFNSSGSGSCGYINDTYLCLKKDAGKEGCKALGDGGRVCGTQASTPPAPDNGTPGKKANPDDQLTQGGAGTTAASGSTYNYYNSSTVNNSNRDPAAGDSSSGTSGSDDSSDGNEDDGEEGAYSPGGQGDFYTKKTDTFSGVFTDFKNSVMSTGFMSAASGFFTVTVGGGCPVWSVNTQVFGTLTIDQQCSQTMNSLWPYISAIVIATAAFFAFRIAFL